MTMDRISELPSEIIHHILSFIPLKYAISTSILSKRWRHQWTFNPHLIFPHNLNIMDIRECLKQYKAKQLCRLEITLELPSDSSKELKYECIFYMKQWIKFAVKRQVQRLIIYADMGKGIVFRAPECLFHSQSIQILGLSRCIFDPPSDFKGFPCLKTLILHRVKMEGVGSIESIVSTSPYLRAMKLSGVSNLQHLNIPSSSSLKRLDVSIEDAIEICGPNLHVLSCVGSYVSDFRLKNLPSLVHSNISSIVCCQGDRNPAQVISEWGSSLANLSQVKVLEVNPHFIQIMYAKNYLQRSCGVEFKRLKRFHFEGYIDTNFTLSALISFLQDCPSLETLRIDVRFSLIYKEEVGYNWITKYMGREHAQVHGRLYLGNDHFLSKLESVTLNGFSGTLQEMKLLEFLLHKAVTLKNIVLQSMIGFGTQKYDSLSRKLSSLPRASLTVKIEFRDELQKHVYTKYC